MRAGQNLIPVHLRSPATIRLDKRLVMVIRKEGIPATPAGYAKVVDDVNKALRVGI